MGHKAFGLASEPSLLLKKSRLNPKLDEKFFQRPQGEVVDMYFTAMLEHAFKKNGFCRCVLERYSWHTTHSLTLGTKVFGNQDAWITFLTGESPHKFGEFIAFMQLQIGERTSGAVAIPKEVLNVVEDSDASASDD